ncbi:hypothetical protein GCM10010372_05230 [Streptomyces tauricus]|nr:hypothetical protein GCM10010372_05230 [Streptomyces tauricus]
MVVAYDPPGCCDAAEDEEVVTLAQVEPERPGERDEHPFRGCWTTLLFDPAVVVGRHAGECRDFLAPQASGAAALPARKSDILGLQHLTTCTEEIRQQRPVHRPTSPVRHAYPGANQESDEGRL